VKGVRLLGRHAGSAGDDARLEQPQQHPCGKDVHEGVLWGDKLDQGHQCAGGTPETDQG